MDPVNIFLGELENRWESKKLQRANVHLMQIVIEEENDIKAKVRTSH